MNKKYIVFGWSRDSMLADELLGTTSVMDIEEEDYQANDVDGFQRFGFKKTYELVQLDKKLFGGKSFYMWVYSNYVGEFNQKTAKKILAYYEIPGVK